MRKMPKGPQQHVSRDQALLLAKRCLPPRWIVREQTQGKAIGAVQTPERLVRAALGSLANQGSLHALDAFSR